MACNAESLLDLACSSEFKCLDRQRLLAVIAQRLCNTMGCSAETLLQNACESRISCLDEKQLLIVIAQLLCDGAGGNQTCIQCSNNDPVDGVDIPPCDCSLWVAQRTTNVNLWKSSDGVTWQIIGAYWP